MDKNKLKIWTAGLLLVAGFLCVLGSVEATDLFRTFLGFGMMSRGASVLIRILGK